MIGRVGNYRAFAVPEGEGPIEFTISVVPAGAIRSVVRAADGDPPADPQDIDLRCYFAPQRGCGAETITSATLHPNAKGEFVVTPVPLGRTCHVVLDVGRTKVFSDAVTLTPERPLADAVTLQIPGLVSATVRVVDAAGRPVAGRKVEIGRSYSGWFTTYTGSRRTDGAGRVTFDGLAAGALDRYEVSVSGEDYRMLAKARLAVRAAKRF